MPEPLAIIRRPRVIADPVYHYISVPAPLEDVLAHPLVQRLRRVGQTALASLVYPSLTGMRFEHALGAMHLAVEAWRAAWSNSPGAHDAFRDAFEADPATRPSDELDFDDFIEAAVACVALLHDIGHPPFSHALESLIGRHQQIFLGPITDDESLLTAESFHEFAGSYLLRNIATERLSTPLAAAGMRIDEAGRPWLLEVNANPDIAPDAGLARMARVAGMDYTALVERMVELAMARRPMLQPDRWAETQRLSGVIPEGGARSGARVAVGDR